MKSMLFMVKLLLVVGLCSSIAFSQYNFTTAFYGMNKAEGYLVRQAFDGQTAIDVPGSEVLLNLKLEKNVPNPFKDQTKVQVELFEASNVSIAVTNLTGQNILTFDQGYLQPGLHRFTIDAKDFNQGIYFYTVKAGYNAVTKKMLVE